MYACVPVGRWSKTEKATLKIIVESCLSTGVEMDHLDWHQIAVALGSRDQKQVRA